MQLFLSGVTSCTSWTSDLNGFHALAGGVLGGAEAWGQLWSCCGAMWGQEPCSGGQRDGGEGDRARWGVSDDWGGRTTPGVVGDVKRMVEL